MKKVTTINLNGRAYQVEEAGYTALRDYLDAADKKLAGNPDKTDILTDIEQAIADKCEAKMTDGKNVVTLEATMDILAKIGPVEPDEKSDQATVDAPKNEEARTLYTLPKEGKLSGVCAGLAAYFGMDVTVMRLIFVVLLFITQGFMILVYIVLAIAMPEAKTPEEVARAHGRPMTAQDIMSRVNLHAPSDTSLARVGVVLNQVGRVLAQIISIGALVVLVAVSAAWMWMLWLIALGFVSLQGNIAFLNGWRQIVFATALYLILVLPLYWLSRTCSAIGKGRANDETPKSSRVAAGASVVLWTLSLVTAIVFVTVYATEIHSYTSTHGGYLDYGNNNVCLEPNRCYPTSDFDMMTP
jgi:phage shock protein PspC (stress-responsive transcriptional regulator)